MACDRATVEGRKQIAHRVDGERVGLAENQTESNRVEKRVEKGKNDFRDTEPSEAEGGPEAEEKAVQKAAHNKRGTLYEHLGSTASPMVP